MDTLQTRTIPSVHLRFRAYSPPRLEVHTPSRQYFDSVGAQARKKKATGKATFFSRRP
jgi:hypothetical protein